jgi:CheY-like chemotaxis protein/anti-sigma regulatory factor (Ser/Thr protein kinase)
MPIVLVADDSPVDRLLVGRLLEREKDLEWIIEYAADGAEALGLMKDLLPDVVVTDMVMPGMNGLELVAAVRASFPQVPVILITGQGSEELALDALDRGAASYVPKGQLADKLLDTVKQVLAVARAGRGYQRLTECFVRNQVALQLDTDTALIAPLVDLVQQMLMRMRFCDAAERVHLGIALEEALLNAFYHGNLVLPPDIVPLARSELSRGIVSSFVQERSSQPPYRDRKVFVDVDISPAETRFVVRDEGAGFVRTTVPERHDPRTLQRGGGRGLVLMRNFMDEVTFNDAGNEVTMVKWRTRTGNHRA